MKLNIYDLIQKIGLSKNAKRRAEFRNSFKNRYVVDNYYSSNYNEKSEIDFYTVSWNSPKLIKYQIALFKKFCKGNFRQIICDNSTDENSVKEIKSICEKNDVTYIRVLDRHIPYGFSNSHECALNWIYENVIKKRCTDFAFLDHDCFPVKEFEASEILKDTPVWGWQQERPSGLWYLWAGFAFFKWETVKNIKLNFHRYKLFGFISLKGKNWVDTGSANWKCLYSKLDKEKVKKCETHFVSINPQLPVSEYNSYQTFDNGNWLHIFDGANRLTNKQKQIKIQTVYCLLDNLLKENFS